MRRTSVVIVLALLWLSLSGCNLEDPAPFTGRQPSTQPPATTPRLDMSRADMGIIEDMTPVATDMPEAMPDADMPAQPADMQDMAQGEMGCVPNTDAEICAAATMIECGVFTGDDGCGAMREVDCGGCADSTQTCDKNTCVCGGAPSCPAMPACGEFQNACGETIDCLCNGANTCQTGGCEEVAISSPKTDLAEFGAALLLRDNMLVVGAPGENANTGAVYIFERAPDTKIWKQTHRLTSSSMQGGAEFGTSLAFDGQTLFVGEPGFNLGGQTEAGAVVLFVLSPMNGQWVQTSRLQAQDPGRRDRYGQALALSGDQLFVGAPSEVNEGYVDIYKRETTTWKRTLTLDPDGLSDETGFGVALASDGTWLAVGEPEPRSARKGGSVHLYSMDTGTWKIFETLALDNEDNALFGGALALEGSNLIVGAPGMNNEDGAVFSYFFDARTMKWTSSNELALPSGGFAREFGIAVAMNNDRAFAGMSVGALPSPLGVHSFVHDKSAMKWGHKHIYQPMSTVSEYGIAIAVDGTTIAVGSPNETVAGSRAGVVYIHDVFF
ncbi:MAG: hypothetical protein VYE40_04625 [Myxococcota bacterium]|nr:hypothetical protein [Myxococcota bacterium]